MCRVKVQTISQSHKVTAVTTLCSTFIEFLYLQTIRTSSIQGNECRWDDKKKHWKSERASRRMWKSKWIIGFMSRSAIKEGKLFFWGWCIRMREAATMKSSFCLFNSWALWFNFPVISRYVVLDSLVSRLKRFFFTSYSSPNQLQTAFELITYSGL